MIQVSTAPTSKPVTLESVKLNLAITDTVFDSLLSGILSSAVMLAESEMNAAILETEYVYYADRFSREMVIPYGRITDVASVEYRTQDGVWNTVATSIWDWAAGLGGCVVFNKPNQFFPTDALYPHNAVKITFTSGFGDASSDVPDAVKHAVRVIASHLFENRDGLAAEQSVPPAAINLLANYRCLTGNHF